MKLVQLKDDFYVNANLIRDISINEGFQIPKEAEPDLFQYFLIVSFNHPILEEEEKVVWIGSAHQERDAIRLLRFIINELTDGSIPVVDLRFERFDKEFVKSLS